MGGRTFYFTPDKDPYYLSDFCELRSGLFQSLDLSEVGPLINVDISHKQFPKQYKSIIDMFPDIEKELSTKNKQVRVPTNQPLDRNARQKLEAHFAGLDFCYSTDGIRKEIKKYFGFGKPPAEEFFVQDGKKISVKDYFKQKGIPIRYPALECIRFRRGDPKKKEYTSHPMEYCGILSNQVSIQFEFYFQHLLVSCISIRHKFHSI